MTVHPSVAGATCETKLSKCTTNPCEHGGTCDDQENGFICHCPPGFTGNFLTGDRCTEWCNFNFWASL